MKIVVAVSWCALMALGCQESPTPVDNSVAGPRSEVSSLAKKGTSAAIVVHDPEYSAEIVKDGLSGPEGFEVVGSGVMYVVQAEVANILKITPGGQTTEFASIPFPGPYAGTLVGIQIDPSRGMFVSQLRYGNIFRLGMDGQLSLFVSGLNYPGVIKLDDDRNLIVSELFADRVIRIDHDGIVTPLVVNNMGFNARVLGNAVADNNVLYTISHVTGEIRRFDVSSTGTVPQNLSDGTLICTIPGVHFYNRSSDLEYGLDGDLIASTNFDLYRVKPTGEYSLFASGFTGFYNVTRILPNGDVIVSDHHRANVGEGVIYRISKRH